MGAIGEVEELVAKLRRRLAFDSADFFEDVIREIVEIEARRILAMTEDRDVGIIRITGMMANDLCDLLFDVRSPAHCIAEIFLSDERSARESVGAKLADDHSRQNKNNNSRR